MKRNTNQRGFGAVEIIIIVVVLALIGVGGWYVWQTQTKPPQNQTQDTPNGQTTPPKTTETFSDSRVPFTFEYPKGWTVKVDERLKEGQPLPDQYSVELQAPGTTLTEQPIGGHFVTTGARVRILDTRTTLTNIQDKFSGFYAQAKDRVNTTVAGAAAVEYAFTYESDPGIFTDFVKDGRDYSLGFYAEDDERASVQFADYKTLVSSFKFK